MARDWIVVPHINRGGAILAPSAGPVPSGGPFTFNTPLAEGTLIGQLTATNSPNKWTILGGDPAGNFAIDNSGNITAAQNINGSGAETLIVQASNLNGGGTCFVNMTWLPPTVTFDLVATPAQQDIGFGATTATFNSLSLGPAFSGRVLVAAVNTTMVNTGSVGAPTLTLTTGSGTQTMSLACWSGSGAGVISGIWYLLDGTSTSGSITVQMTATNGGVVPVINWISCFVASLEFSTGAPTSENVKAFSFAGDPQTCGAVTIPTPGGLAVATGCNTNNQTATLTFNFTLADEDNNASSNIIAFIGTQNTPGAFTSEFSGSPFSGSVMATAAWTAI